MSSLVAAPAVVRHLGGALPLVEGSTISTPADLRRWRIQHQSEQPERRRIAEHDDPARPAGRYRYTTLA